ncbi:MAG: hypothetical protein V4693_10430 [Pseudomonadota bacterium]
MNVESITAATAARHGATFAGRLGAAAALAACAAGPPAAHGAPAAAPPSASAAVRLENIPGSTVPRVILAARAAQRLGIETATVSEEAVVRKQMVGGLVIPPMDRQPDARPPGSEFGGFARPLSAAVPAPGAASVAAAVPVPSRNGAAGGQAVPAAALAQPGAAGPLWVLVTLSPGEWEKLAKDKPARLLQLATRDQTGPVLAQPSGMAPTEDAKRSMLSVYYTIPGVAHGLAVNNRVRVELPLAGSDDKQKVVPYSAVYYDAKGRAWVYINSKPLTYERRPVSIERVIGNQAILSDGPAVGTPVVSTGAALLFGAEIFKK